MELKILPFVQLPPSTETSTTEEPEREPIGFIRKKVFPELLWETKRIDGDYDEEHYRVSVEKREYNEWCTRNKVPTKNLPQIEVGEAAAVVLLTAIARAEETDNDSINAVA